MALACALATAHPATAQAPIRFTHVVETGRGPISIPTELYLEARNDDIIAVKVAGNLGALQAALPVLLSRVVEDTCRRRVGVEVQTVHPEGDALRLTGRVQIISYRCRGDNLDSRLRIFSNVTGFDALVDGRLADNCLGAELEELSVDPSGLVGGLINLLGLRERIASSAPRQLKVIIPTTSVWPYPPGRDAHALGSRVVISFQAGLPPMVRSDDRS
jgi:hypothetical protein